MTIKMAGERKALKAWLADRIERKALPGRAYTQEEVIRLWLQNAEYDARDYLSLAESGGRYGDIESLVREMRLSIVDQPIEELRDGEGEVDIDAETLLRIQGQLVEIADEAERRMRAAAQSIFDRIGPPKSWRRPIARKQITPPGAHGAYK